MLLNSADAMLLNFAASSVRLSSAERLVRLHSIAQSALPVAAESVRLKLVEVVLLNAAEPVRLTLMLLRLIDSARLNAAEQQSLVSPAEGFRPLVQPSGVWIPIQTPDG